MMKRIFTFIFLFFLSFGSKINSQVIAKTTFNDTLFIKKNQLYRVYDHADLFVLNPQQKPILYSIVSLGGYKNMQVITHYFFSETLLSPVYQLSKANLKIVFFDNIKFIELLDIYCTDDDELLQENKGVYILNTILKLSQTN